MKPRALDVYPKRLEREPEPGDHLRLTSPIGTAGGAWHGAGTVFRVVSETDEAPHGMADPYHSNLVVETPLGTSVWSSVRLMLHEGTMVIIPRDEGAVTMVLQS